QGVRGSNPSAPPPQHRRSQSCPSSQRRFLSLSDCPIRATRVPLGADGGRSRERRGGLDQLVQGGRDGGVPASQHVLVRQAAAEEEWPIPAISSRVPAPAAMGSV